MGGEKHEATISNGPAEDDASPSQRHISARLRPRNIWATIYPPLMILLLLLNYFLAQYDKFILSYFQREVIRDLNLTSTQYGLLSGYATGIISALSAIVMAFVADYSRARVWTLTVAALWWNVCCIFQGYSHNFWQMFLARLAMSIGQSPVEALSVSILSDIVPSRALFFVESVLYVGVYIGEAVSAQIATAFDKTNTPWNDALKAIGIVGLVLAVILRLVAREPSRKIIYAVADPGSVEQESDLDLLRSTSSKESPRALFVASIKHIVRMRSFWILTLSAGARQFSGNVFGYYMPSYLSALYPSDPNLLSHYGIIVGAVGSAACLLGGLICSSTPRIPTMALFITAIGGMISAAFVLCMIFSKSLAHGSQSHGTVILYGSMSVAYITAELWLGAFASLLAALLPPRMKTFCLAIYQCVIILMYSSAPQIIGLGLSDYVIGSPAYIRATRFILAAMIPGGYWVAGIGFLFAVKQVRRDLLTQRQALADGVPVHTPISRRRWAMFGAFFAVLASLTIALLVTSLVYD